MRNVFGFIGFFICLAVGSLMLHTGSIGLAAFNFGVALLNLKSIKLD
jgi:hypothetical protein